MRQNEGGKMDYDIHETYSDVQKTIKQAWFTHNIHEIMEGWSWFPVFTVWFKIRIGLFLVVKKCICFDLNSSSRTVCVWLALTSLNSSAANKPKIIKNKGQYIKKGQCPNDFALNTFQKAWNQLEGVVLATVDVSYSWSQMGCRSWEPKRQ